MERNRNLFEPLVNQDFEEYLEKIRDHKEWVGEVEMKTLSLKYKIDFIVYYDINKPPLKIQSLNPVKILSLACTGGNRYDCVYSKADLSALAFCQAIVYEVLYKKVYELGSDVDIAVEKMLHDKAYSKQRRNNLLCHYFRESCCIEGVIEDPNLPEDDQAIKSSLNPRLEIRKALSQGVPPFPYKVAKTLDPGIYRNVEFDMWNEKRKEDQKNEQFIIPKLEPGVKCKVHINKDIYIGHVQDIFYDCENVSVYIEELCKRCVVSASVLEILPVPAYKGSGDPHSVDIQALTWQGGKTYKVYSDSVQSPTECEKSKYRKGHKKNYQDQPLYQNCGSNHLKPNVIARSNSMPTSAIQRNCFSRTNNLCNSPLTPRKKGHSFSSPASHKSKSQGPKEEHKGQPLPVQQAYTCIWNGLPPNLPTSAPMPIPPGGKMSSECFQTLPRRPEMPSDLNDSSWHDESFKAVLPAHFSPSGHYPLTSPYPEACYHPSSSPLVAISTSTATSLPVPIPGTSSTPPANEEGVTSPIQQSTPMAIYPYSVYTVPGMYLVCRDGSTLPVGIGGSWNPQEAVNGDLLPGVPSVYFNTPPNGVSPSMGSWIPNYSSSWSPATAVAFTPPLEMGTYLTPPWTPTSSLFIPPPTAYQVQPPSVVVPEGGVNTP